jgi:hypothetical protein
MMFVPHRKHTYGPPRPVTELASPFICRWCSYLTGSIHTLLHGLLQSSLHFLYVENIRTSQEAYIRASTACYGASFTVMCFRHSFWRTVSSPWHCAWRSGVQACACGRYSAQNETAVWCSAQPVPVLGRCTCYRYWQWQLTFPLPATFALHLNLTWPTPVLSSIPPELLFL